MKAICLRICLVTTCVASGCADDRGDALGAAVLPVEAGASDAPAALDRPSPDRTTVQDAADGPQARDAPVDEAPEVDVAPEVGGGVIWPTGPVSTAWTVDWIGEPAPPPDAGPEPDAGAKDAAEGDGPPPDSGAGDGEPPDSGEAEAPASVGARIRDQDPGWGAHEAAEILALWAGGKGVDVSAPDDQFLFVHQSAAGDVTVRARVRALANCGPGRITFGLMVRAALTPDAPYVMAAVSGTPGAALQLRSATSYLSIAARIDNGVALPVWLRASRQGNRVLAGYSKDGQSWKETELAVTWPPGTRIGLVASSHRVSAPCDGLFDDVSVTAGGD
jgi:hypothetical protein